MADSERDNPRDPDLANALAAPADPDAFGAIYERHVDRIYAYAITRLHDPTLAEDATAATFSRARRDRSLPAPRHRTHRIPSDGRERLLTIARNVVIDLANQRRGTVALDIDDYTTLLASREPGPAQAAERNDQRRQILDAVRHLNATQRRIVLLRFQGWKGPEIAELLGMSPGAVRVAQHRAFLKLRELLEPATAPSPTEEHRHA